MKRPTPTQAEALRRMAASNGEIHREEGGFWTVNGVERVGISNVPRWWCAYSTIRALEAAGWIERKNEFPEAWRDTRRITDAGREAVREMAR